MDLSTTMACRSPDAPGPPSIFVSDPSGYFTLSLSEAYVKETGYLAWVPDTIVIGMPYGTGRSP